MGHWAQRKRSGGSQPDLNYITRVTLEDDTTLRAFYRRPVDASQFATTGFSTTPGSEVCEAIFQDGNNQLLIDFTLDVLTEDALVYTGSTPGIFTPQSQAIG